MALEVIGAGFGRTGTASLREALEHLGFVKCHHMFSLGEQRRLVRAWHDVALKGARNWDEIFDGYRATVDWPSTGYYKELTEHYPGARVILTVRDPDRWYESVRETLYAVHISMPRWLNRLPRQSSNSISKTSRPPSHRSGCSSSASAKAGDRYANSWVSRYRRTGHSLT